MLNLLSLKFIFLILFFRGKDRKVYTPSKAQIILSFLRAC